MTKQVQRRRGTATQHTSFTGAEGEISVNTTNKSVHVHDGTTAGGIEAARADLGNVSDADLNTALSGNTLASLTITSADINGGTIDGTSIGATTAAAGSFTSLTASGTFTATSGAIDGTTIGGTTPAAVTTTSLTATTADINGGTIDGTVVGGTTPAAITGTTITGTSFVTSGDMTFGDNDKAIFGAGSDLQIYHDGAHSRIQDTATGSLILSGTNFYVNNTGDSKSYIAGLDGGTAPYVRMYYDGATRLDTNSTGIDVTGTVTADGLTGDSLLPLSITAASGRAMNLYANGGTLAAKISSTGDISFYEDTGTTPKLFWDASAERLGLGTTSPDVNLDIESTNSPQIRITDTGGSVTTKLMSDTVSGYVGTQTNVDFSILTNNFVRATFDTSGNVGIGTSSPTAKLSVTGLAMNSASGGVELEGSWPWLKWKDTELNQDSWLQYIDGGNFITKQIAYADRNSAPSTVGAERMRIDSSGNLLVGKTSDSFSTQGQVFAAGGYTDLTRAGTVLNLNRLTSDGDIVKFYKDGTTVGSIGTNGGDVYIGTGDTGVRFVDSLDCLLPLNTSTNATRDAAIDIGYNDGGRFKDLYLSGKAQADSYQFAQNSSAVGASEAIYRATTGTIAFKTNSSERLRITSSGNLLVNQTSVLTGGQVEIGYHGSSTYGLAFHPEIDGGRAINFKNAAGVTVGSIQNTSSATSYNTSSDYRLKEDVQPMTGASERVLALNPVNFAWKDGGDRTDGFIAHEAQAVVPEAVTGTKDAMRIEEYEVTPAVYDGDGNVVTEAVMGTREVPDYQGIDQSKLVPLLTAALQEALKRIEALEAKL